MSLKIYDKKSTVTLLDASSYYQGIDVVFDLSKKMIKYETFNLRDDIPETWLLRYRYGDKKAVSNIIDQYKLIQVKVGRDEPLIVGMIRLDTRETLSYDELIISDFYIESNWRSLGIGGYVMNELVFKTYDQWLIRILSVYPFSELFYINKCDNDDRLMKYSSDFIRTPSLSGPKERIHV